MRSIFVLKIGKWQRWGWDALKQSRICWGHVLTSSPTAPTKKRKRKKKKEGFYLITLPIHSKAASQNQVKFRHLIGWRFTLPPKNSTPFLPIVLAWLPCFCLRILLHPGFLSPLHPLILQLGILLGLPSFNL